MTLILYTLAYLWIFWAAYVLVMGFYRAYLNKRLNQVTLLLSIPFVAIGIIMDIVAQFTIATIVFCQVPCITTKKKTFIVFNKSFSVVILTGDFLVTARLQRYVSFSTGWRFTIANWICNNLLDIFDPTGEHC